MRYTILSEVHDEDLNSKFYIGTRKPISMALGVNNVLKTYGFTVLKDSFIIGKKCHQGYDRPFGEPEPQHWYWDVRHPDDEAFLKDLDKDGHINTHGAIVLDWREHQATSQHQVG